MLAEAFKVVVTAPWRWANPLIHCAISWVGILPKTIDETFLTRAVTFMSGMERPTGMIVVD
jgi:hypothetical protein